MARIRIDTIIGGQRITAQLSLQWHRILKREATYFAVGVLDAAVKQLMRSLPRDTGRLQRGARRIVYARDERSFRVYSTAPYSRYVKSAPPVWRQMATRIRSRLRSRRKIVYVPVDITVRRFREPARFYSHRVRYQFNFADLQPQVNVHAQRDLDNEIRGTFRSTATLRSSVIRTVENYLLSTF
ncbi:MAG: hypothetical protein OXH70_17240 [Acidobacteria bacterium]|nr:hypothetical protein [Acidobacteriota bacterium]